MNVEHYRGAESERGAFPVEYMMYGADESPKKCPVCKNYIPRENINFATQEMKCTCCDEWVNPWCFLYHFG